MPLVQGLQEVQFNELRAAFPQRIRAPFGYTDFIGEYASSGFPRIGQDGDIYSGNDNVATEDDTLGGMEFDTIASVVYPRSMFVPHDNEEDSGGYYGSPTTPITGHNGNPLMAWSGLTSTDGAGVINRTTVSPGFSALVYEEPLPTTVANFSMNGYMSHGKVCQGFTAFFLPLYLPNFGTLGQTPTTTLRWRVSGSDRGVTRWYAVSWSYGDAISFWYNDTTDGLGFPVDGFWVYADNIKTGEGRALFLSPDAQTPGSFNYLPLSNIEVRFVAGQMRIYLGSTDTPYIWPHYQSDGDGVPDWYINYWQIACTDLSSLEWSVHPTKFRIGAGTVSVDINVGQVPDDYQIANIVYTAHFAPNPQPQTYYSGGTVGFYPSGSSATITTYDVFGTTLRYRLIMDNPASGFTWRGTAWSDLTACIRAVTLDIPPRDWQLINPPTVLGTTGAPPMPMSIDISHDFDLQTLSIRSRASMAWSNFRGNWTNWYGTGILDEVGHFATAIDLGIVGFTGMRREFTGIANTDFTNDWGGGGKDYVRVSCEDMWLFLDVPVWNLPWFDGWNVYYVMYYLASLGGLTPAQMLFYDLVPARAYDPSPGLPDYLQTYMQIGPAGAPLTRFGGGQKLRDIMLKISVSIGYTLFFNVLGGLNFYKFQLPTFPTVHVFSHLAGDALDNTQPGLGEIWSGSYRSSLREVKNAVTVIGVNALGPLWNPIVAHEIDLDSIFNDAVANYKGFLDPMVWADSQFADAGFADSAAASMLAYLRIPAKDTTFRSWYPGQAPVYPGDIVQILYPRSGVSLFWFFVVATRVRHAQGEPPTIDITGRLVPVF